MTMNQRRRLLLCGETRRRCGDARRAPDERRGEALRRGGGDRLRLLDILLGRRPPGADFPAARPRFGDGLLELDESE